MKRHMDMNMDMSGMSGMADGQMSMTMADMAMTFFSSTTTSLYSTMWTPTSAGEYAGTCIFLILVASFHRAGDAARYVLERKLASSLARKSSALADKPSEYTHHVNPSARKPWRASIDLPRATFVMIHAGIGWLLMLVVMTMNIGYFISVLVGTFVGEVALGRFSSLAAGHGYH